MTTKEIDQIIENPEENGFSVKVTCEKCGYGNFYQNNDDAISIGCLNCAESKMPEKGERRQMKNHLDVCDQTSELNKWSYTDATGGDYSFYRDGKLMFDFYTNESLMQVDDMLEILNNHEALKAKADMCDSAMKHVAELLLYFKSGNSVPIKQATIKADCGEIKNLIELLQAYNEMKGNDDD